MRDNAIVSPGAAERRVATSTDGHRLRLLVVMAQGFPDALPEAWRSYAGIEDARASALAALRHPRVSRVGIVVDESGSTSPLRLVEWVNQPRPR